MNDSATFVYKSVRYEVDVDGVNRHKMLMVRLPDNTVVQLDFPRNSLVPAVTRVDAGAVNDESIRAARVYVWNIEFRAFGRRYVVTIPEDAGRLDESLGKLPDGRHVVLDNPLDIPDAPFEQVVLPGEQLFAEAKAAGRIYEVRRLS